MRVRALPGLLLVATLAVWGLGVRTASAADCPGNPDALGVSRVLVVDPTEHPRIGTMQYRESLPLQDHEVVLTFDDGPLPTYSARVLETLAAQCVKATYFMVGRMAQVYPDMVKKIYAAGHTIGTHSQNHPLRFEHMSLPQVQKEVDDGIASVGAALGDPAKVAPFFRIPGLLRATTPENFLASRGIMVWSADFPADDWTHISSSEVMRRALARLEQHHKGVLLLHDIHARTALMLPQLLRELKRRGYKIVQVVPASATQPKTPTTPDQWLPAGTQSVRKQAPGLDVPMQQTASVPLQPLSTGPQHQMGPSSGVIESGLPAPSAAGFNAVAATPVAPATSAVVGAAPSDAGPTTTANLPHAGIP
jgi:peptidoglycan/xylan/chitin deacetylase (PgdA/CDA1 family)